MSYQFRDNFKTTDGGPLVLSGPQALSSEFPVPQPVIGEWLREAQSAMIYGRTGIGKSWLAMSVALAIASGEELLGWEVPRPRRVLYMDAEIDTGEMVERIRKLTGGEAPERFMLCSGLRINEGLPDLADPDGQSWYELMIEKQQAEVVVIDNLCSVLLNGSISEDQVWLPVQPFLNRLRSKGITVVLVHHAGKTGDYLGSSRMTQNLNTVVKLERPRNGDPREGANVFIEFQKGRSLVGDAAATKQARLVTEGERLVWSPCELSGPHDQVALVAELVRSREFASQQEIADVLRTSQSVVSGRIREAEKEGLLSNNEARSTFKLVKHERRNEYRTDDEANGDVNGLMDNGDDEGDY